MLTPEYLDNVPDELLKLYTQAEVDILCDMAARINAADLYIPSTQWQEYVLQQMGMCHEEIVTRLSKLTGKTNREIERLITNAGAEALRNDAAIYKAAGVPVGGIYSAPFMVDALKAGIAKTRGVFFNLTRTTANTATRQFERALDRAYMQVSSGAFSPQAAVQGAIKELAEQGVRAITYPTGHVDTIEVAVRRAVVTGANQTAAIMSDKLADDLDCDLVEVTAHAGARPSHAEWQGQIYSRSGKSKIYPNFEASTGYGSGEGLCGWNCRHSFFPYYEGTSRAYTSKMLKEYSERAVNYNGATLSEYDARQQQRYYERQIRRWRREEEALGAAGQPTERARAKVREWRAKQSDFVSQTGLKRQYDRERIAK